MSIKLVAAYSKGFAKWGLICQSLSLQMQIFVHTVLLYYVAQSYSIPLHFLFKH